MKRIFQLLLLCLFTTTLQGQIEYGCATPSINDINLSYFEAESNDDIFPGPYDQISIPAISPLGYYHHQDTLDVIADSVYFSIGTNSNNFFMRLWVDWNFDGLYDDSEIVYTGQSFSSNKIDGAFTIPSSFTYGSVTRVRVSINEDIDQLDECRESGTTEWQLRNGGPRLTISSNSSGTIYQHLVHCIDINNPINFEILNQTIYPVESYDISIDELSLISPDGQNYLTFDLADLVIDSVMGINGQNLCTGCPIPYEFLNNFNSTFTIHTGQIFKFKLDITDYPIDFHEIWQGEFRILANVEATSGEEGEWENQYKISCCEEDYFISTEAQESEFPFYTKVIDFIELGNEDLTINNDENVNLLAGTSIDLLPGFNTEIGAKMDAFIAPCIDPAANSNGMNRLVNEEHTFIEKTNERVEALTSHPNPFDSYTNIQYQLEEEAAVNIQLFNAQGRYIKTLVQNEWQETGSHSSRIDTRDLPLGLYICKLMVGNSIHSIKLLKTK